jgi:protein-disulfide isomerase
MVRFWSVWLVCLVCACRPSDGETTRKLDQVLQRIQVLEEKNQLLAARIEALREANDRLHATLTAALQGDPGAAPEPERKRPDPATVFSVPIDGDAVKGPRTAKVTIVEGAEFACQYCLKVRRVLAEIEKKYGKDVRFVYKSFVIHPEYATEAALAACAAQQQGRFWEMEGAIWAHVWDADTGEPKDPSYLGKDGLVEIAGKLKLDAKRFEKDMAGDHCKDQIDRQERELLRVGTRGTPSFYVNGRHLSGALPLSEFSRVIDEEIAKADAAYKQGIKPDRYYETIVATGQKVFEE